MPIPALRPSQSAGDFWQGRTLSHRTSRMMASCPAIATASPGPCVSSARAKGDRWESVPRDGSASSSPTILKLCSRPSSRRSVTVMPKDGTVRLTIKARPRSYTAAMPTARDPLYQRHRFPLEVISHAVWLYFRFPLSLRMVEEMLATRGICVTYETVRQWERKFGKAFADQIRQRAPARGDKWHMDEVVISIAGEPHWLWRAVDQNGFVLDVLVQRRRDT